MPSGASLRSSAATSAQCSSVQRAPQRMHTGYSAPGNGLRKRDSSLAFETTRFMQAALGWGDRARLDGVGADGSGGVDRPLLDHALRAGLAGAGIPLPEIGGDLREGRPAHPVVPVDV